MIGDGSGQPEELPLGGEPSSTIRPLSDSRAYALEPWDARSPVPAAMLNPALIAAILAAAANQYEDTSGVAMPWTLSFLVPPIVLHRPSREALPRTSKTSLSRWVAENATLSAGFPARATHLLPHVREGLRFGLRHDVFHLTKQGAALYCENAPKTSRRSPGDLVPVIRGAGMLGRIFARTGDAATVFAALRVRP